MEQSPKYYKKAPIIRAAFEMYAAGNARLEDIATFLYEHGIRSDRWQGATGGGKRWHVNRVKRILTNMFYYGDFKYAGEIYKGTHTPIVSKQLFDRVQATLKRRGRSQKPTKMDESRSALPEHLHESYRHP